MIAIFKKSVCAQFLWCLGILGLLFSLPVYSYFSNILVGFFQSVLLFSFGLALIVFLLTRHSNHALSWERIAFFLLTLVSLGYAVFISQWDVVYPTRTLFMWLVGWVAATLMMTYSISYQRLHKLRGWFLMGITAWHIMGVWSFYAAEFIDVTTLIHVTNNKHIILSAFSFPWLWGHYRTHFGWKKIAWWLALMVGLWFLMLASWQTEHTALLLVGIGLLGVNFKRIIKQPWSKHLPALTLLTAMCVIALFSYDSLPLLQTPIELPWQRSILWAPIDFKQIMLGVGFNIWNTLPSIHNAYELQTYTDVVNVLNTPYALTGAMFLLSIGVVGTLMVVTLVVWIYYRTVCLMRSLTKKRSINLWFMLGGLHVLFFQALLDGSVVTIGWGMGFLVSLAFLFSSAWLPKESLNTTHPIAYLCFKLGFFALGILCLLSTLFYSVPDKKYQALLNALNNPKRAEDVVKSSQKWLIQYPYYYPFLGILADGHAENAEYKKALETYGVFLEYQPWHPVYRWRYIQMHLLTQKTNQTIRFLQQFLERFPEHKWGLELMIILLKDKPKEQIHALWKLAQINYSKATLAQLMQTAFVIKDWEKSMWALKNLIQYEPNNALYLEKLRFIEQKKNPELLK